MMSSKGRVGILGATGIIGECLLPLLVEEGWDVVAFSRQERYVQQSGNGPVEWQLLEQEVVQVGCAVRCVCAGDCRRVD